MVDLSMKSVLMILITIHSELSIDEEAAKKWLSNGAQPTEVVGKLFKMAGIEK